MDSLENEKQRSLLDGSLLDDPLPLCNSTPSPIYSPFHEKEALTSPDPLASFSTVQPGSVRTFQVRQILDVFKSYSCYCFYGFLDTKREEVCNRILCFPESLP